MDEQLYIGLSDLWRLFNTEKLFLKRLNGNEMHKSKTPREIA